MTGTIDDLKKQRNIVQKDVATKKKANEACDDLVARIKSVGDEIIAAELEQKQVYFLHGKYLNIDSDYCGKIILYRLKWKWMQWSAKLEI